MGMGKLLKEDLSLLAESKVAQANAPPHIVIRIKERVTKDYEFKLQEHETLDVVAFNDDAEYKRMMNEAIDCKNYALEKIEIYLESVALGMSTEDLERIFNAPLVDWASQAQVLRLRTGIITEFPWEEVVQKQSATIDLGNWNAASLTVQARDLVSGALRGNQNVRTVVLCGFEIFLSSGWSTDRLEWQANPAVQKVPATVSLLLRSFDSLLSLDIR
jgi:hypothetical protein